MSLFRIFSFGALALIVACGAPESHDLQAGESDSSEGIVFSGQILGADGSAPALADLHFDLAGEESRSIGVDGDGRFSIELPAAAIGNLKVSAVDHIETSLPLVFNADTRSAELRVQLAANPWAEDLDSVRFLLVEGVAAANTEVSPVLEEGRLVWRGEATRDELTYQLVGATSHGHTVNGLHADSFRYDGGGDYLSVLAVEPGEVEIVFDPSAINRVEATDSLPMISWDEANVYLADFNSLHAAASDYRSRWLTAYRAAAEAGEDPNAAQADGSELIAAVRGALDAGRERLAAAAMVELARSPNGLDLEGAPGLDEILAVAPAERPIWALHPDAAQQLDAAEAFATSPLANVRMYALIGKLVRSRDSGDEASQRLAHSALKEAYGEERAARYYLSNYDLERRIQVGQKVPDFEVALFDGGTFNQDSFGEGYVLLDFWATWCGPCVTEMPELERVHERFADRGFQVLSLSLDRGSEAIGRFREERFEMDWSHTYLEGGFKNEVPKSFEVVGIPEPILVGPDGTIVAMEPDTRVPKLEETLERLLGEG